MALSLVRISRRARGHVYLSNMTEGAGYLLVTSVFVLALRLSSVFSQGEIGMALRGKPFLSMFSYI